MQNENKMKVKLSNAIKFALAMLLALAMLFCAFSMLRGGVALIKIKLR